MSRTLIIIVCAVIVCALPGGDAAGAITYKNATNPTGVPDIAQGINPYCFEVAVSNGLWYFDQARSKTGLVKHSAKDVTTKWPDDTVALAAEVRKYTERSARGIYRYIYVKRPGDAKLKGKGRVRTRRGIEWRDYYTFPWSVTYRNAAWRIDDAWIKDKKTQADEFGWIGVKWHVKGDPAGKYLAGDGHELGIAGYDDAKKELVVTNGWGHHHLQTKTPVSSAYYDKYDFTQYVDASNKKNNRLRITDTDLTTAVFPPQGKEIDYCEVTHAYWLNGAGKTVLSAKRHQKPFQPLAGGAGGQAVRPAEGGAGVFDVLADNEEGGFDMYAVDIRLPLVDPSAFSLGHLQNVDMPPDWQVDMWQPNDDPNPMADDPAVYGTIIGEDWIGLRFSTEANPVWIGEADSFSFELPESLLTADYIDAGLDLAAWDADHGEAVMTLGVPEPATLLLLLTGAAACRRPRSQRKSRRG